ncbi:MBG domain-containing protein [Acinetobacter sp. YH12218]|uniref:MBG domain-containing protein n=1 Tax=Acinetobacter sp. YH12218 TaxID=2601152 RepID=UPI0015D24060|nr:MBG domain-containing protein [Acinetobacter sp. YH12218]
MNKIYKIVWNKALGQMVVVSEHAKSAAKGTTVGTHLSRPLHKTQNVSACPQWLLCSLSLSMALVANATWAGVANTALPTGANITQGSAQISQNNNSLNINQNSQNLSTNWNTFNIGKDATVNFNQPNQSSIAVNRVLDNNASQIMGKLNANGQVFLLNPNGVIFSKTAQVNVGGIVASTLNLSDSDIAQGKFTLKNSLENQGNVGSVENYGSIIAGGGVVALIAPTVKNHGTIQANNGVVHLTAADQVTLQLQDGSLVEYQIDLGTLQGLVENGGAIQADNGAVYLTAQAKNSLSKTVVNHTGIIEANRLEKNAKGEIILLGDMQTGTTTVSGTLKAEGKNGQDGGFIETSAANVQIADSTQVSTRSDGGKTGEWLIDPFNVTISNQAQAGNNNAGNTFTPSQNDSIINVGTLNSALASNNITVTTAGAGTQAGNINVNADVTWNANTALTLRADNDININANITATNNNGKLNLQYGQTTSNINANYYLNNGARVNLKAGQNFSTQKGANAPINYTVITDLGAAGSTTGTDLQGINGGLTDNYVLGADIDATATSGWNAGQGFSPIGTLVDEFKGKFDGLNHTISNLYINRPSQSYIGLFGYSNGATIQNVGIMGGSITGHSFVGGLVGRNYNNATIHSSYATAQVIANSFAGGLTGANSSGSRIENSYATGDVTAQGTNSQAGGLSGNNYGNSTILNSYATGKVTGVDIAGGLLGNNDSSTVENSYATGQVSISTGTEQGGLVGRTGGTIKNSYWNKDTTGQGAAVGDATGTLTQVQGLSTAQMKQGASFVGFDIDGQGGTGKVWRIYEGNTAPLLRSFLTQATLDSLANQNKTYNGQTQGVDLSSISLAGLDNSKIFAGQSSSKNVGTYNIGLYSNQQGYDLIGGSASLTIDPATLTITANAATSIYGDAITGLTGTVTGFVNGENLANATTGTASFSTTATATSHVGQYAIAASGLTANNGNYVFVQNAANTTALTINPATLTITADAGQHKVYGDTDPTLGYAVSGWKLSDDNSLLTGALERASGENAGLYAMNKGTVAAGGNYTIAYNSASPQFEITPATLTITADAGQHKVYGDTDPTLGYAVSGWKFSDDNSLLTGALERAAGKNVGNYAINQGSLLATSNYDISYTGADFAITPRTLTATINAQNKVYDGNSSAAVIYGDNRVSGDFLNITGNPATFSDKNAGSNKTVIVNGLTLSGADAGNYVLAATTATDTADISKAQAIVTANSLNTVYNGQNQTVTGFSATGLVGGEDESVLTGISTTGGQGKNAGSYSHTASGTDSNYDITFVDGALEIAKAKATVTANSLNTVYNGKDQTVTGFTASGLVAGEDEAVLSNVSASVTAQEVGNYANKVTGSDDNYELTFVDGVLSIQAKPIWGNPYQRAIRTQPVQQKPKAFEQVEIEVEGQGINLENIQTLGSN